MPLYRAAVSSWMSQATAQLPSQHMAHARQRFAESHKDNAEALRAWRGYTYTRRCLKSVGSMALSGAALPGRSDIATSTALFMVPLPRCVAQLRQVPVPYLVRPLPTFGLLAGACALGGASGAPRFEAAGATQRPAEPVSPASMGLPDDTSGWEQALVDIFSFGVLGKLQMMVQTAADRLRARGSSAGAAACQWGATTLLYGLELIRLPLQLVFLALEVVPAVPLAAVGGVVGLFVFLWTPLQDLCAPSIADEIALQDALAYP